MDSETQDNIEQDISKYYDDSNNSTLYVIGSEGYTVINYDKALWEQHKNISDFGDTDKEVFLNEWIFTKLK